MFLLFPQMKLFLMCYLHQIFLSNVAHKHHYDLTSWENNNEKWNVPTHVYLHLMAIDRCKQLSFSTVKLKDIRSDEWKQKVKTATCVSAYLWNSLQQKKRMRKDRLFRKFWSEILDGYRVRGFSWLLLLIFRWVVKLAIPRST